MTAANDGVTKNKRSLIKPSQPPPSSSPLNFSSPTAPPKISAYTIKAKPNKKIENLVTAFAPL